MASYKHFKFLSQNKHFANSKAFALALGFARWPIFKMFSPCQGYSHCKIVTLGQKLKFSKTCQKQLYKHIKVVLCKKQLPKTTNTRKMTTSPKSPKFAAMQRL